MSWTKQSEKSTDWDVTRHTTSSVVWNGGDVIWNNGSVLWNPTVVTWSGQISASNTWSEQ